MQMSADKTKTHTTLYFAKEESDYLLRAAKLRGEQLFGRSNHGKVSAYITRLIKKDLRDNGILELDPRTKKLVPVKGKLDAMEKEILNKLEADVMDNL